MEKNGSYVDSAFKIAEKEIREYVSREFFRERRKRSKKIRKQKRVGYELTRLSAHEPHESASFSWSEVIDSRNAIASRKTEIDGNILKIHVQFFSDDISFNK